MKRWITAFAFPLKWGAWERSWARAVSWASSEASAILPSPTPHSPKKWRRVRSRQQSLMSAPGDELVQVEKGAEEQRPGRPFDVGAVALAGDPGRVELVGGDARPLGLEVLEQERDLGLVRRAREAAAEEVRDLPFRRRRIGGRRPARVAGGLDHDLVVQHRERLEWRVGDFAPGDARLAAGTV